MFIFGHIGITLGILLILKQHPLFSKFRISYPMLVLGAMLPDLIDKPLGEGLLADSLGNGRIYAHTLLFCILLLFGAIYYNKRKNDNRVFIIPAASFLHLMEDRMWRTPATLFWPLFGWEFPKGIYSSGLLDYFYRILMNTYSLENSYTFLSEMLGIIILIVIGIKYKTKEHKNN
ncbi:MAG: metal-dependent hydrolase [Methanolobus sp.]